MGLTPGLESLSYAELVMRFASVLPAHLDLAPALLASHWHSVGPCSRYLWSFPADRATERQ